MDRENANLNGNCSLLNGRGESDGMRGIRGTRTDCPASHPVTIVASIRLGYIRFTTSLVPLQSLGGSVKEKETVVKILQESKCVMFYLDSEGA